jgi:Tol biopolymer transport system component
MPTACATTDGVPSRRRGRRIQGLTLAAAVSAGLLGVIAADVVAGPSPQRTVRVRLAASGDPDGRSTSPSLSADARRLAFASTATNLVDSGDANGHVSDVFVFDQGSGAVALASTGLDGKAADGPSTDPVLSGDGGVVAFTSLATNLVAGDANRAPDVFVRVFGAPPVRVSVATGGAEANGSSTQPDVSADGGRVVFTSSADSLVADDINEHDDVFVRDLATGTTSLVSATRDGGVGSGDSSAPAISPDGRYVTFSSKADDLVADDDNGRADVFLRDLETGRTSLVSVGRGGRGQNHALPGGRALTSDVSRDGRFVVFESSATNLVAHDRNNATDVFVRDRAHGLTRRVSLSITNEEGGRASILPTITPDGRFVAFASRADDLVPESAYGLDVFVRDTARGTTTLADVTARARPRSSELDDQPPERPSLSADASTIAFASSASNLAGGDANRKTDVFLRRLTPAASATAVRRVGLTDGRLLIVFQSGDRAAGPLQCRLDEGPPKLCPLDGLLLPRLRRGHHVLRALAGAPGSLYAGRAIVIRIDVGRGVPRVRVQNPGDDLG